jgi:hypothetical protein
MNYSTECCIHFPQFRKDFELLRIIGAVEYINENECEWKASHTSLGEYFREIGRESSCVVGGFWNPIENLFHIQRGTLRCLASRATACGESKGYRELKDALNRARETMQSINEREEKLKQHWEKETDRIYEKLKADTEKAFDEMQKENETLMAGLKIKQDANKKKQDTNNTKI